MSCLPVLKGMEVVNGELDVGYEELLKEVGETEGKGVERWVYCFLRNWFWELVVDESLGSC